MLATVHRANGREGIDFLLPTGDCEEGICAAGRIPGSFMRRDSRSPERATLACRLIDRPIRPLFPSWMRDTCRSWPP